VHVALLYIIRKVLEKYENNYHAQEAPRKNLWVVKAEVPGDVQANEQRHK